MESKKREDRVANRIFDTNEPNHYQIFLTLILRIAFRVLVYVLFGVVHVRAKRVSYSWN